jgi:arylsulfatase A-like enzyme
MKRDNWEGGHRVPFIARWPGKIAAGSTSDQTLNLTDVMATCAAIVESDLPNEAAEDSVNLLPALLGTAPKTMIRPYTMHQTISLALAIRMGHWKYLDHKGSGGNSYERALLKPFALPDKAPETTGQLYNLKSDPGETTNVADRHPEIAKRLKRQLEEYKQRGRSVPERN